jgi:hypothetical protein
VASRPASFSAIALYSSANWLVPADGIDGACPGVQVGIGKLGDDIDGDFQPVPSLPEQPEDIKDQNYNRDSLTNDDPEIEILDGTLQDRIE